MTTERGILYSDEMVRAKLDGRKTVTRRVIKPQPRPATTHPECKPSAKRLSDVYWSIVWHTSRGDGGIYIDRDDNSPLRCPYGKLGDILYVREAWYCDHVDVQGRVPKIPPAGAIDLLYYRATDTDSSGATYTGFSGETMRNPWRSSIHMPKWAARIWDEIVDVRPERLWDITEYDALQEGINEESDDYVKAEHYMLGGSAIEGGSPAVFTFIGIWDSINANHPWSSNPWVWRIETKEAER